METDRKIKFTVQVSWNKEQQVRFCWPAKTKLRAEIIELSKGLFKLTLIEPAAYVHFVHDKQYDDIAPNKVSVNVATPNTSP